MPKAKITLKPVARSVCTRNSDHLQWLCLSFQSTNCRQEEADALLKKIQHRCGAFMIIPSNHLAACRQCMQAMFLLALDILGEANGDSYHGSSTSDVLYAAVFQFR